MPPPDLSCGDRIPSCLLWRQDFILSLCGDKLSSCRRHVQVEHLHPQFKCPHPTSLCGDKISSCLFVATRSPSCRRHVQVENLHPQFKCPARPLSCGDKISSCLFVATRSPSCRISKLQTCTHNSNAPTRPVSCGDKISSCLFVATRSPSCRRHVQVENLHPQFKCPHTAQPQRLQNLLVFCRQ